MNSKRKQLIEQSAKLFNREGFRAPSIDQIVAYANIGKMTFYRYFPDKISLIEAILEQRLNSFLAELSQQLAQVDSAKEKLYTLFHYYAQWFVSNDYNGCLFTRSSLEYGQQYPQIAHYNCHFKSALTEQIQQILRLCLKPEPAERVSVMVLMLIDGAIASSQYQSTLIREYQPAETAFQAAKALIYSEGGTL
ncbi:TetR/AcrR family transcriptional regulator [Celerinatantimonas diazotrophica]|uniref:TetR family transcriptional regulator n=1 Tax=Celerinatantimonas diazotrophica TaxID=412034 RepID=A0A4R1K4I3_9GAMM|nr:TetR/AcrR family transcriptional regulator [Celerinatantimonas diazotrophica]TCK57919.1 TetR family transcriptional regulator [Celerinatantimonas diazotrophica]CAG9298013.1 hypothetical protein CEDIAZO_03208 [Celerinatantimonas diazotrophica]